jgi:hypothetical protein
MARFQLAGPAADVFKNFMAKVANCMGCPNEQCNIFYIEIVLFVRALVQFATPPYKILDESAAGPASWDPAIWVLKLP